METQAQVMTQVTDGPPGGLLAGLTQLGWDLPPGLTIEQWAERMAVVGAIARRSAWALGDGLEYGDREFGEQFAQYVEETGYDPSTLLNMAWVARRWPKARRRDQRGARWSHHAVLAALQPAEQDRWIAKSIREGWGSGQLREAVRAARAIGELSSPRKLKEPWRCGQCSKTLAEITQLAKEERS